MATTPQRAAARCAETAPDEVGVRTPVTLNKVKHLAYDWEPSGECECDGCILFVGQILRFAQDDKRYRWLHFRHPPRSGFATPKKIGLTGNSTNGPKYCKYSGLQTERAGGLFSSRHPPRSGCATRYDRCVLATAFLGPCGRCRSSLLVVTGSVRGRHGTGGLSPRTSAAGTAHGLRPFRCDARGRVRIDRGGYSGLVRRMSSMKTRPVPSGWGSALSPTPM